MELGAIGTVIDTLEFNETTGQSPDIIRVSGNIFAIAYCGPYSDGFVSTVNIDSMGNIGAAVIDTLEFDEAACWQPKILHISGDIYAIAYETTSAIKVVTVDIDSTGAIENAVVDTFNSTDTGSNIEMGSFLHISGNYYAIAYNATDYHGQVITITIDSSGNIGASETDTLEFDASQGVYPSIVHVSGTMYAIAYCGSGNDGWVCTFNISTSGVIDAAVTDTEEFDGTLGTQCNILSVTGDIYVISYKGSSDVGYIKTLSITSAGAISTVIDTLTFDASSGQYPSMVKVGGTVFAVAYQGVDDDGFIKTFTVSSAGLISTVIDYEEFDTSKCTYPKLYLAPNGAGLVVVAYEGSDSDGFVKTLIITALTGDEAHGVIAVVEDRLHYVDAYGTERYIKGTAVP